MEQPRLEFAFEIRVDVSEGMLQLGTTPKGTRKIVPICGGNFEGPAIKGTVLAGDTIGNSFGRMALQK